MAIFGLILAILGESVSEALVTRLTPHHPTARNQTVHAVRANQNPRDPVHDSCRLDDDHQTLFADHAH